MAARPLFLRLRHGTTSDLTRSPVAGYGDLSRPHGAHRRRPTRNVAGDRSSAARGTTGFRRRAARQYRRAVTGHSVLMGVIARIGQVQRGLGGVQLLLQGEQRATSLQYTVNDGFMSAVVMAVEEMQPQTEN